MRVLAFLLTILIFTNINATEVKKKGVSDWTFIFNPAKVNVKTDRDANELNGLARELINRASSGDFLEIGINTGYVEAKIKETNASLKFFKNQFGANDKALRVSINTRDGKLYIKLKMYYKHIKHMFKKERDAGFDRNRWNYSNLMEKRIEETFKSLLKSLPSLGPKIIKKPSASIMNN
tara:strand:+ start:13952 stop:14488 length:537 start_codon:yes stop_codon:yes gene_type:complete